MRHDPQASSRRSRGPRRPGTRRPGPSARRRANGHRSAVPASGYATRRPRQPSTSKRPSSWSARDSGAAASRPRACTTPHAMHSGAPTAQPMPGRFVRRSPQRRARQSRKSRRRASATARPQGVRSVIAVYELLDVGIVESFVSEDGAPELIVLRGEQGVGKLPFRHRATRASNDRATAPEAGPARASQPAAPAQRLDLDVVVRVHRAKRPTATYAQSSHSAIAPAT